jgi:hypothetical protein
MTHATDLEKLLAMTRHNGEMSERIRIIDLLKNYFELTKEPDDEGVVTDNPEWDAGFQAAMALIKRQGEW